MSKTIADFDFKILGGRAARQSAFAVITVDGSEISDLLATDKEIDDRVKNMKDDLDRMAQRAKAALKKLN